MAKTLTTPTVAYRCWNYEYERPGGMGWPTLIQTGWEEGGHKPSRITPRKITVQVRQHKGGEPSLSSISVTGTWTATGQPATGKKILHDAEPGYAMVIYAPDWVHELAADAVSRAKAEVTLR